MRVRNRILELDDADRLQFTSVPLPDEDQGPLKLLVRDLLRRIDDPEIFEFVWHGSEIRIDDDYMVHYPSVEEWEWEEAMSCPVPHPHVWIETASSGPDGANERIYIWDVTCDEEPGFTATPLVFDKRNDSLAYFATQIVVRQNDIDDLGRRGTVKVFNALPGYANEYDIDEFYEHANMLARFFRILCHPKVVIGGRLADKPVNTKQRRQDRKTKARRRVVRISQEAFQYQTPKSEAGHASPKEHHRRAHKRRYADGRETTVRECVVNRGQSATPPLPQSFSVD